jgi:hypothetical protein
VAKARYLGPHAYATFKPYIHEPPVQVQCGRVHSLQPARKRLPARAQPLRFDDRRGHAVHRVEVDEPRIAEQRQSCGIINVIFVEGRYKRHGPAMPKCVWKTSTMSPGRSAMPPPSGS